MINFDKLDTNKDLFRSEYLSAKPFSHLIIKDFCDKAKISKLYSEIPNLENKSRDYMFAKNKFEVINS